MLDFKIKRGLSTTLFTSPGVINPRLIIEEGAWYLCTDIAALFLGVVDEATGQLTLKRINRKELVDSDINVDAAIEELQKHLKSLEETQLFKKINSEAELPRDFEAEDFNPNITYYIQRDEGRVSTYIFDFSTQSYMCTSSIDELVIRAMITDMLELTLNSQLDSLLPNAVKSTIEGTILYGGNATPNL